MINEFLVLGKVPFTNFQITFNEMVAIVCILYLIHKYLQYTIEIHRWFRQLRHKMGVNYRLRKRMLRTYIKNKRYRLAVFERRLIRQTKSYLRHKRHAIYMTTLYRPYSSLKRQYYIKLVEIERLERKAYRSRLVQGFIRFKNFVDEAV